MSEFKCKSSLFRLIFGVEYTRFISPQFLVLHKVVTLDIIKFDDYLKRKYKDYVEGISMKDFVYSKFGEQGCSFINEEINRIASL